MDFREKLVAMIKSSGQELIDKADDLAGKGDGFTDFDIHITIMENGLVILPFIDVTTSRISKRGLDILTDRPRNCMECSYNKTCDDTYYGGVTCIKRRKLAD